MRVLIPLSVLIAATVHAEELPGSDGVHGEWALGVTQFAQEDDLPRVSPWDDEGLYPALGFEGEWRSGTRYLDAVLGYRSSADHTLQLEGGRQGEYRVDFLYDRFTVRGPDGALTPYLGIGSDTLTLPAGWSEGATTDAMADLDTALHPVTFDREHNRMGIAAALLDAEWRHTARVERRTVEGLAVQGAAVGTNFLTAQSVLLPVPVSHRTDNFEAATEYTAFPYDLRVAFSGSVFDNDDRSVTWQNAFDSAAAVPEGRIALAPDNSAFRISAEGGYRISEQTRATARVAYGRLLQNAQFLPYTVNGSIASRALPRDSLDGRIDTWNTDLKLVSRYTDHLTLDAAFKHEESENLTPRDTYDYIINDTAASTVPRINLPYSHRRQRLAASASYALAQANVQGGVAHERVQRIYQEAEESDETSLWLQGRSPIGETTQVTARVERSRRDGSYDPIESLTPAENPLLRKYYLAQRDGNRLRLRADGSRETFGWGIEANYADFDYGESEIGLRGNVDRSFAGDLQYQLGESIGLNLFAALHTTDYSQAGSSTYSTPDWQATGSDRVTTLGVRSNWRPASHPWEVAAELTLAEATSALRVGGTDYPDIAARWLTFDATLAYHHSRRTTTELRWWLQQLAFDDQWALEGVSQDTIANLLTLGEGETEGTAQAIRLLVRQRF